ncbi:hypothetical protein Tco_1515895 [Tanacetum coccineum]
MHQPSEESIKEFEKHLKTVVISALEGVIQPPQEMSIQDMEDLKQQYLVEMKSLINSEYRNEIKINDLKGKFNGMSIKINKKKELQYLEQVVNLSTYPSQHFNSFCYDDDDDEEATIQVREYYKNSPVAITPDFSIMDSLIMEDEHLDTIPEMDSDELIKSSVKNLVTILSESEDFSDIESEYDVPVCDDFMTSSNPLFDSNDDSTSSDDESLSDENVPKEIYSNPLFDVEIISTKIDPHHFNAESDLIESLLNRDTSIISSSKIDSLLKEFSDVVMIIHPSTPRKEFNSENSDAIIESFSPSPIPVEDSDSLMEEIDLFLTSDNSMPPGIENDDYDSEGDILFLEELLSNDSPSLPENESFHFDIPSSPRPPAKPPDDGIYFEPDTGLLTTKVVGDISEHYVLMPKLLPTQPTLCPVNDTLIPFSSENKDKVHLLSHRGFKASKLFHHKSPMLIHGENIPILDVPFLHFYPP